MPERCNDVKAETGKAADQYYKTVGEWIRSRMRSESLRRQSLRLASAYRRSLDLVVDCYRRVRRSPAARAEFQHALELKSLLQKDMEALSNNRDLVPPAGSE